MKQNTVDNSLLVALLEAIVIRLIKFDKDITNMNQDIQDFKAQVAEKFAAIGASVDTLTANLANAAADEAAQADKIADLQAQLLAGASTLTAEDKAALADVVTSAAAQADKVKAAADASQALADSIPDAAPPAPPAA